MEKSSINLFDSSSDKVELPKVTEEFVDSQKRMMDSDISDAILGEKVKTIIIPEESNIQQPNYVLDFSECEQITIFQKSALQNLISKDGDVSLYLYNKKQLMKFGMGNGYKLESLIPLTKKHIFGDDIKVYKNLERDKPVQEVKGRDITKLRLNL